jgi:hypothetical protein
VASVTRLALAVSSTMMTCEENRGEWRCGELQLAARRGNAWHGEALIGGEAMPSDNGDLDVASDRHRSDQCTRTAPSGPTFSPHTRR